MRPTYPGIVNSPATTITTGIEDDTQEIPVTTLGYFPPGPNLAVLGEGKQAETVRYSGKSSPTGSGSLTGVTRGVQGVAKAWDAGTVIARRFTAYDYDTLRENLNAVTVLEGQIVEPGWDTVMIGIIAKSQSSFVAGTPISFIPVIQATYAVASFDWDFDDQSAHSSAAAPVHTYSSPGTYTVVLTVVDGEGYTHKARYLLNVTLKPSEHLIGAMVEDRITSSFTTYAVTRGLDQFKDSMAPEKILPAGMVTYTVGIVNDT